MNIIKKSVAFFALAILGLFAQSSVAFAATTVSSCNSVTLHGYIAPSGGSSTVWFEWSSNSSTVSNGSGIKTPSKTFSVSSYFDQQVTGLNESSTYYYRTAARNTKGTVYGQITSFKTSACDNGGDTNGSVSATTNAASSVMQNSAKLNGHVSMSGDVGTVKRWFEYGTNSNNLSEATSHLSISSSNDVSSSVSGLSSDTTYYFRLAVDNNGYISHGSVRSFTTDNGTNGDDEDKPSVTTNAATDINDYNATLKGYVNTNGSNNTEYWFEWGTSSSNLNRTTSRISIYGSGYASAYIGSLSSDETYYFRVIAQNDGGTSYGNVRSFTTDNGGDDNDDTDSKPEATTRSATSIGDDFATLNGYIDTNGSSDVTRWFEWGRSSGSLNNTTSRMNIGYSGAASSYISGLSSDTTYYYRIISRNDNGTSYGSVYSFTTKGDGNDDNDNLPEATTRSASSVDSNSATLNGYVDANNGSNTYGWFEWGRTSDNLSNSTTKRYQGSSDSTIASSITGLNADTTYYYRAVGQNSRGTTRGSVLSFTTSNNGNTNGVAPTGVTMLPTNITGSSATLNSLVLQSGNIATSAWFEWGTSEALGRRTSTSNVGSAPSVRHNENVTGLSYGTTYYFRVVAENANGRNYGIIRSFVAKPAYIVPVVPPKPPVVVPKPKPPVVVPVIKTVVVERAEGVSSLVMLTITGEDDTITKGKSQTYTVTWKNNSTEDLRNVILRVIIPQSLSFESADDGSYSKIDSIHTLEIGSLKAGETGEMNISLKGATTLKADDLVVTTANIVYTDESSIQGDALAYTTQRVSGGSVLGASVASTGGVPTALLGWLLLIILLIILGILIHNLYKRCSASSSKE